MNYIFANLTLCAIFYNHDIDAKYPSVSSQLHWLCAYLILLIYGSKRNKWFTIFKNSSLIKKIIYIQF